MAAPKIINDPLYQLLRDGKVQEFNQRIAAGETVDLIGCDFRHVSLVGLVAKGLDFTDAYFRQSDLRGVDFTECKSLKGASIHAAKISGVYFPVEVEAKEILLSLEHGTRMRYRT
ncbi:MAG TPA: hypothetical protein ENI26_14685 [Methylophaga aminisulfidivorans]|uniref:Pentapeptide repeat-containing protein n=2 Tax=root TaxID=1 RepID=A0A7C2AD61_9GAMM|nr:hypothetical protein [Methylophaga sp.]HEC75593.1 hypothetical protein [Methylophaga aminisulfidivorans]